MGYNGTGKGRWSFLLRGQEALERWYYCHLLIFGTEFVRGGGGGGDHDKRSTQLRTFLNSFKDLLALDPSNPKSGHRGWGAIPAHSVAQFQWNYSFVPGGPEPFLSLEVFRGKTLKFLLENLSSAYSHPVGFRNSFSYLFSAFLLSGAPNTWTGEGIYPRLLSKAAIITLV